MVTRSEDFVESVPASQRRHRFLPPASLSFITWSFSKFLDTSSFFLSFELQVCLVPYAFHALLRAAHPSSLASLLLGILIAVRDTKGKKKKKENVCRRLFPLLVRPLESIFPLLIQCGWLDWESSWCFCMCACARARPCTLEMNQSFIYVCDLSEGEKREG